MRFKRIDSFGNEIKRNDVKYNASFSDFAEVFLPKKVNSFISSPVTKKALSTTFNLGCKAANVAVEYGVPIIFNTAVYGVKSVNNMIKNTTAIANDLVLERSPQKAVNTAIKIGIGKLKSGVFILKNIGNISYLGTKVAYRAVKNKDISVKDKEKLKLYGITVAATIATIWISGEIYDSLGLDTPAVLIPDIDNIPFIDNGVFCGNDSDLEALISMGEIENTNHIDVIRDYHAVDNFYKIHDIQPIEGYEVHHIIPLSEGGADNYENMVLIRSDLHSKITEAHNEFYGWHTANK